MHRNTALSTAAAIIAVLALGGCSWFSSDDEAEAAALEQAIPEVVYAPVATVRNIEIGRTRDGYVITAQGFAPGLGYSAAELRPRREGKAGPDGYIDYDFFARTPDPNLTLGEGELQARLIRADLLVTGNVFQGAVGIRVHGVSGGVQMQF